MFLPQHSSAQKTWQLGINQSLGQGLTISSKVMGRLDTFRKVFFFSARVIVSVYRTNHTPSLLRESGLLSADLGLDKESWLVALCAYCFDHRQPLFLSGRVSNKRSGCRFSRWALELLDIGYADHHICAPWAINESVHASIKLS